MKPENSKAQRDTFDVYFLVKGSSKWHTFSHCAPFNKAEAIAKATELRENGYETHIVLREQP